MGRSRTFEEDVVVTNLRDGNFLEFEVLGLYIACQLAVRTMIQTRHGASQIVSTFAMVCPREVMGSHRADNEGLIQN